MTKLKFFQELINSLFVKQKNDKPFSFFLDKKKQLTTKEYLHNVASAKGEVSALNHAELLLSHCEQLNDKELMRFFELLRINYELFSFKGISFNFCCVLVCWLILFIIKI